MVKSRRTLSVYLLLLYLQTCHSVQSSALFKLSVSGMFLACFCTLVVAFINLYFSYEQGSGF